MRYAYGMRISIIGLPASGKTRLAQALSKKYAAPHIHLDRFWFESGGPSITHSTPPDELSRIRAQVREKALEAIAGESWISDGFYSRIQPEIAKRADKIIFLDIPLWQRLINHMRRVFQPGKHKELTFWDEIKFFPEIIRREKRHAPKIRVFIAENAHKVTTLRSHKEADAYVHSLKHS